MAKGDFQPGGIGGRGRPWGGRVGGFGGGFRGRPNVRGGTLRPGVPGTGYRPGQRPIIGEAATASGYLPASPGTKYPAHLTPASIHMRELLRRDAGPPQLLGRVGPHSFWRGLPGQVPGGRPRPTGKGAGGMRRPGMPGKRPAPARPTHRRPTTPTRHVDTTPRRTGRPVGRPSPKITRAAGRGIGGAIGGRRVSAQPARRTPAQQLRRTAGAARRAIAPRFDVGNIGDFNPFG